MKFINFKLLNLILFTLINLNFSELYSLHLFGSNGGSAGAETRAGTGTSDTGSSGSRAAVGSAFSGLFTKSHSDGDLSTLLARTAARLSAIEASQKELGTTISAETSARAAALTSLDGRVATVERTTTELTAKVSTLEHKLITEARYRELETKETVRDGLKITVPSIVDGAPKELFIRLSPASKAAYDTRLQSLETNYESALARARGPQQDDMHADDKKFLEDTVLGNVAAGAGERAERVAEKLTPAKFVAAAAATGLAVWLVKRRT